MINQRPCSGTAELEIDLPHEARVSLRQYCGQVIALAFIVRRDCGCDALVRYLLQLHEEYGTSGFHPIACLVDLLPGETVPILELGFTIGGCPRKRAADIVKAPMSAFAIPQIAFIDRAGCIHSVVRGGDEFCSDFKANARVLIQRLLRLEPARVDVIEGLRGGGI